jgi:hypothetical protein
VPHQFFASSMLVTPLVRGLLGWEPDAPRGAAVLAPQPHPAWSVLRVENLRVGDTEVHMTYRRGVGRVDLEMEGSGPALDLTYRQALPLGARNVTVSGNPERGGGRQTEGRHDTRHEVTFTLTEGRPVRLSFRWEGGLEVYREPNEQLRRGSRSKGPRVLDLTQDGEDWLLTVEGQGGVEEHIHLRGERVEPDLGSVRPGAGEASVLTIPFPETGPRVVRTVRLTARNRDL